MNAYLKLLKGEKNFLMSRKTDSLALIGDCGHRNGRFYQTFFDGKTFIIPIFDGPDLVYTFFIVLCVALGHLGACC